MKPTLTRTKSDPNDPDDPTRLQRDVQECFTQLKQLKYVCTHKMAIVNCLWSYNEKINSISSERLVFVNTVDK